MKRWLIETRGCTNCMCVLQKNKPTMSNNNAYIFQSFPNNRSVICTHTRPSKTDVQNLNGFRAIIMKRD